MPSFRAEQHKGAGIYQKLVKIPSVCDCDNIKPDMVSQTCAGELHRVKDRITLLENVETARGENNGSHGLDRAVISRSRAFNGSPETRAGGREDGMVRFFHLKLYVVLQLFAWLRVDKLLYYKHFDCVGWIIHTQNRIFMFNFFINHE